MAKYVEIRSAGDEVYQAWKSESVHCQDTVLTMFEANLLDMGTLQPRVHRNALTVYVGLGPGITVYVREWRSEVARRNLPISME